jgi:hypothetical protein
MSDAPHLWLPNISQADLAAGIAREQQEQQADDSYAELQAPPCPACGQPVKDSEWESHKARGHDLGDGVLPYGQAGAREVFVTAYSPETIERLRLLQRLRPGDEKSLEQKKAEWRAKHPGLSLLLAGEGTRGEGRVLWARYRVMKDGRPVR